MPGNWIYLKYANLDTRYEEYIEGIILTEDRISEIENKITAKSNKMRETRYRKKKEIYNIRPISRATIRVMELLKGK